MKYTIKNGISNLYILLKSALKMQEMPFQKPKFQKIPLQFCRHYGLPLTKIMATKVFIWKINIKTRSIEAISL